MLQFICYLFFTIGFMVAFIGIAYGAMCLTEKIQEAIKRRNERITRLINALERIEANTRKTTQA